MKGWLAGIRSALQRLYRKHELRPGAANSGVFVKLCLVVADKPFIRHVCGLTSHNADAFGAPFSNCTDTDLYNFTHHKRDHYGDIDFETLCNRVAFHRKRKRKIARGLYHLLCGSYLVYIWLISYNVNILFLANSKSFIKKLPEYLYFPRGGRSALISPVCSLVFRTLRHVILQSADWLEG